MGKINIKSVVAIIIIFLFIGINIPYSTSEPYTDTEYYTEKVPYTDIEYYNYTVTEPYIETVSFNYTVVDAQYMNYFAAPPSYLWVTINNTDTESGYFDVDFYVTAAGEAMSVITEIPALEYLPAGETKTVKVSFNGRISEFRYTVQPPTKEVTKYRDITKQTTMTKYREVQKSREVVKIREVKLSILQRIL